MSIIDPIRFKSAVCSFQHASLSHGCVAFVLPCEHLKEFRSASSFSASQRIEQYPQPLYGDTTLSIRKSGQSTGQIIAAVTLTVDPHRGPCFTLLAQAFLS